LSLSIQMLVLAQLTIFKKMCKKDKNVYFYLWLFWWPVSTRKKSRGDCELEFPPGSECSGTSSEILKLLQMLPPILKLITTNLKLVSHLRYFKDNLYYFVYLVPNKYFLQHCMAHIIYFQSSKNIFF